MQTKFHFDTSAVNAIVGVFAFGFLLMLVPLIVDGKVLKLAISIGLLVGSLAFVWFGFSRGTYITIDEKKNVYGTLFFIKAKVTALSDVISIHPRHTFGGAMTEVYMKYRKRDGTIGERGLVNKQGFLKKSEFRKLLETIRSANPIIEIDPELRV